MVSNSKSFCFDIIQRFPDFLLYFASWRESSQRLFFISYFYTPNLYPTEESLLNLFKNFSLMRLEWTFGSFASCIWSFASIYLLVFALTPPLHLISLHLICSLVFDVQCSLCKHAFLFSFHTKTYSHTCVQGNTWPRHSNWRLCRAHNWTGWAAIDQPLNIHHWPPIERQPTRKFLFCYFRLLCMI